MEIFSSVLYVVIWIVGIPMIVSLWVMRTSIKGTRNRYVAASFAVITISTYIVLEFTRTLVNAQLTDDVYLRAMHIIVGSVAIAYFTKILYKILTEEDSWFNDQWKKLQRWLKNVRTARRLKPAYAV